MLHVKMLAELMKLCEHAIDMRQRFNNDPLVVRRWNDWTTNHLRAATTDTDGPNPGVVTLPGIREHPPADVVDTPGRADPVGEHAIHPTPEGNYEKAIRDAIVHMRILVSVMAEATRPTTATEQEHESTVRHAPDQQPGAGTCEACGKFMPGGEPRLRIRHYQARALCPRDHRQVHRDLARGIPIDRSIETIRTYKWRGDTDEVTDDA